MTNFIFKSQEATYKKLANQLEVILNEQRHQRQDLAAILYLIKQLRTDLRLQDETDKYYDKVSELSSDENPQNATDSDSD